MANEFQDELMQNRRKELDLESINRSKYWTEVESLFGYRVYSMICSATRNPYTYKKVWSKVEDKALLQEIYRFNPDTGMILDDYGIELKHYVKDVDNLKVINQKRIKEIESVKPNFERIKANYDNAVDKWSAANRKSWTDYWGDVTLIFGREAWERIEEMTQIYKYDGIFWENADKEDLREFLKGDSKKAIILDDSGKGLLEYLLGAE